MRERFSKFREIYPYLRLFEKDELKGLEPNVVLNADKSGDRSEEIVAMGVQSGEYTTIDFGRTRWVMDLITAVCPLRGAFI